ncbi:conserved Plasmodium protein, unknown function [Plasmodium malariae]|uniref:Ribosomal RNA-processing protein 12-like conserved domain-containing protein n=1 Tax=Plasmodium malariae TaxID=5858 RepID=A0A1C3KD37_PLAMA|nr:conserved Plasmodium protein, unknown function [Plasmodium malariae]
MDKFKRCKKRNFRSLIKNTKSLIKRKNKDQSKIHKSNILTNEFITNIIIKYVRKSSVRNANGSSTFDEFITHGGNTTECIKEKLFSKKEIVETDIINNCLIFDKNETLKSISYKILYGIIKKCVDHENVLMKIEELGFSAENIKDKNDDNINICSKYKVDTFFNYIYKSLKVIKCSNNFNVLCKLMNVIKYVIHVLPYMYKIKFLFFFCSIFNIYQKLHERGNHGDNIANTKKAKNVKTAKNVKDENSDNFPFTNVDDHEFLNIFFELMNELININDNYNSYDDNYKIFNFFVLRWMLVYFKNKYHFFSKKNICSRTKSNYAILLLTVLKHLHESMSFDVRREFNESEQKYYLLSGGPDIATDVEVNGGAYVEANAAAHIVADIAEDVHDEGRASGVDHLIERKKNGHSNITNYMDILCNNKSVGSEKIKNNKAEIQNMIEIFYDKVDLKVEKKLKEVKDTMNILTQNIFIIIYKLFSNMHIIHQHIVLLYFSLDFLRICEYEYSYFIIFNSFQFLNKLLTVQNFLIHAPLFMAVQEVFTFYEKIIIHLYKEKNDDINEEFYHFVDLFNNKHKSMYEDVIKRIWSLYMLIISDEYMKRKDKNLKDNSYVNVHVEQHQQVYANNMNEVKTFLKIKYFEFSNDYRNYILTNVNETYKNILTSCLTKSFRILGLNYFFEEYFFFSNNELLAKDIFILNKILKDTNKLFYGGNLKFVMNFFYPLLMCYINLYEKEEKYSVRSKLFLTYIKNVLIHLTRSMNDCINLYYFMSTKVEDFYILVTKLTNYDDFNLLPLLINFFEHFYLSTLKINDEVECFSGFIGVEKMKNIKCKYTNINLKKNNFFLNYISDNLLKIFIPKFVSVVTFCLNQKFSSTTTLVQENMVNIHTTIEKFSDLIRVCLYYTSTTDFNDIIVILEQHILRNEIEKNIISVISFLLVLKMFTPFFSYEQLKLCSTYYEKLIHLIGVELSKKSSYFAFINCKNFMSKLNDTNDRHINLTRGDETNKQEIIRDTLYYKSVQMCSNVVDELPTTSNQFSGLSNISKDKKDALFLESNNVFDIGTFDKNINNNSNSSNSNSSNSNSNSSTNNNSNSNSNNDSLNGNTNVFQVMDSGAVEGDVSLFNTIHADNEEREGHSSYNYKYNDMRKEEEGGEKNARTSNKIKEVIRSKRGGEKNIRKRDKIKKGIRREGGGKKNTRKSEKIKKGIRSEGGEKTNLRKRVEKLRKIKIKKDLKSVIEKLIYARILIFDNVSALFQCIANIFLKEMKKDSSNSGDKRSFINSEKCDITHRLNSRELNIFNNIYVGYKIIENNLPTIMTRKNIFLFFENISNYNINKYIKKFYIYLNNLTLYLKVCKGLDRNYSYDLFCALLPIIMKSLFYINKKFTTKLRKNNLFENIVYIGKENVKNILLHVTPGLLVQKRNCKKIAIYILYLLVKKYKVDYEDQVQLFKLCIALSNENEKSVLKVLLKFLLICVDVFNKDVVISNITGLMKLLNSVLMNRMFTYLVEKFILKLHDLVEQGDAIVKGIGADRVAVKMVEVEEVSSNGLSGKTLINYLEKPGVKIFKRLIANRQTSERSNRSGNTNNNSRSDKCYYSVSTNGNGAYSDARNGLMPVKMNGKKRVPSVHMSYASSDYSLDEMSKGQYEDISNDSDNSELNLRDDNDEVETNGGEQLKNQGREIFIKSKKEERRSISKGKMSKENNNFIKKKNENKYIANLFFEKLQKCRGEKETTYIKETLNKIVLSKKKKKEKNKIKKVIYYNKNICEILCNIQKCVLKKSQKNLSIIPPLTNQKEINNLFGENYFIKKNINKEKKKYIQEEDSLSNSDEEKIVGVSNDGKIIIRDVYLHSNDLKMKKKKSDDIINKKYNLMNEKQNMHYKLKSNKKGKNKKNTDLFFTGSNNLYKSKKGKGDIIKKNKPLPYSYVPLKPIMTRDKFREKTLHAFRSIKNNAKGKGKKKKN